jgi:hypothetical protein
MELDSCDHFRRLEFWGDFYIFGKFVHPALDGGEQTPLRIGRFTPVKEPSICTGQEAAWTQRLFASGGEDGAYNNKTQDNKNLPPRDGALIPLNVHVFFWSLHSPNCTAWWVDNLQLMIMNVQKGENGSDFIENKSAQHQQVCQNIV